MLDTNIVSAFMRDPESPVLSRINEVGSTQVCTSIIVAAELRYGAARQQNPRLTERVESALTMLNVLPWEAPVDITYARIRAGLESVGRLISANDLLIAAHALALGLTLVTDNEREFLRVPELAVENWLRPG